MPRGGGAPLCRELCVGGPGEVRAPSVKLVELPATSRDPAVHPAPFLPTQLREESGPVTEYCLYLWFILLWKMKKS